MNIKTKIKVSTALAWIGAVIALMAKYVNTGLLWVGLALVVAAGIYRYTMIRCPHCGHKLIEGKEAPKKCPSCGEDLE